MERRSLSTSRRSHATSSTRKATKSGFSGLVEKGLSANFRSSSNSASVKRRIVYFRAACASAEIVTFTPEDKRSMGGGAVSFATGCVEGREGSGARGRGRSTGLIDMGGLHARNVTEHVGFVKKSDDLARLVERDGFVVAPFPRVRGISGR